MSRAFSPAVVLAAAAIVTVSGVARRAQADPPVDVPAAIGTSATPEAPSAAARRENIAALRRHRAGRYAEARDGFRRAVALAPDYEIARYNLACALSRLNDVDGAARELEALLFLDLPRFAQRFEQDPDLESLRVSPAGAALRGRIQALGAQWMQALGAGAPVTMMGRNGGRVWARAGVWVPATQRFVAMAPPVSSTPYEAMGIPLAAALLDPELGRVVAVTGEGRNADVPSVDRIQVSVFRAGASRPEAVASMPLDDRTRSDVEIHATPEGARFRIVDLDETYLFGPWRLLRAGRTERTRDRDEPARPALHVMQAGWFRRSAAIPGFAVRSGALETPRGRITLPTGHGGRRPHDLVLSPDGTLAVVISIGGDMDTCAEGTPTSHVVDLVELATGRTERLDAGRGWATALFGPDGAFYLQRGETLIRHASARDRGGEPLPEGVLLSPNPPECR